MLKEKEQQNTRIKYWTLTNRKYTPPQPISVEMALQEVWGDEKIILSPDKRTQVSLYLSTLSDLFESLVPVWIIIVPGNEHTRK